MTIHHIWHFSGEAAVPGQLRNVPLELFEADLLGLSLVYDVLIYRNDEGKVVLALDARGRRFRQR